MIPFGVVRGSTVLLVDDEKDILSICAEYLNGNGIQTILANNGAAALRLLEERAGRDEPPCAAIVCDWMMPVMDGLTLLARVRSSEFRQMPFVLMSGAVSRDVLLTAVKHDPDAVLLKPFPIATLLAKIEEAIKSRERKERARMQAGAKPPGSPARPGPTAPHP